MEELIKFFENTNMFYIATIENGKPRVRPFGNLMYLHNGFYINTGRKKRFYQQIQINPFVEICAFDKGVWYRVEAKVNEEDCLELKKEIMDRDAFVKRNYADKIENLVPLRLSNIKAYRCRFNEIKCVYES